MGSSPTKEEIVVRLDDLDKEEIKINKELRKLQIELNQLIPEDEQVKVKKYYYENEDDLNQKKK